MKIIIDRSTVFVPNSVLSIMYIDGIPRFVTLENRHKLIPVGKYKAFKDYHYGKPGDEDNYEVWELQNVPGRTQIQIHIGNEWNDSKGCVLIGERFGFFAGIAISDSRKAHKLFMNITQDESELEVIIV